MLQDDVQVGLGDQVQVLRERLILIPRLAQQASGAHLDLPRRLLAGDIQHREVVRHRQRHLQQQGGLADAWVAADQYDGAGHHTAAKHSGKLPDREGQALVGVPADIQSARPALRQGAASMWTAARPLPRPCCSKSRIVGSAPCTGQRCARTAGRRTGFLI